MRSDRVWQFTLASNNVNFTIAIPILLYREFRRNDLSSKGRLAVLISNDAVFSSDEAQILQRVDDYYSLNIDAKKLSEYGVEGTTFYMSIVADPFIDSDGDKVSDLIEFYEGTDAKNARDFLDSDGNGIADAAEVDDSLTLADGKPLLGGQDYLDSDKDGIPAYLDTDDDDSLSGVFFSNLYKVLN